MTTPHRDFEPFENAANLDEDLGLFEGAMHRRRHVLDCPPIETVCVLDGDNTSKRSDEAAAWFARRTNAVVGPETAAAVRVATATADRAASALDSVGAPALLHFGAPPVAPPRVAVFASEPDRAGCPAAAFALRLAGADGDLALVELATARTASKDILALQPEQETSDKEAAAGNRSRACHAAFGSLVAALQHRTPQPRTLHVETRSGELSDELASVLAQLRPDVVVMARVDAMTRSVLGLLHGAEAAPSMVLLV